MDVALIDNKTVIQVWRNTTKEAILLSGFSPQGMGTLHEFNVFDPLVAGMIYENGTLTLPKNSAVSAESLTRRQLLIGLLRRKLITPEEAANDPMQIPALLQFAFSQIPDASKRAEAMIEWRSASMIEKSHPLFVSIIGDLLRREGQTFDAEAVNAFFAEYSQI